MIKIGIAGIALSCKGRTIKDGISDISLMGLNAMEIQMIRPDIITRDNDPDEIKLLSQKKNVELYSHTPYYIDLLGDEEIVERSINNILETAVLSYDLGIKNIIVNTGMYHDYSSKEATDIIVERYKEILNILREESIDVRLMIEHSGWKEVFGTIDEIEEVLRRVPEMGLAINIPNLHSLTGGSLVSTEAFKELFYEKLHIDPKLPIYVRFSGVELDGNNILSYRPIKKSSMKFEHFISHILMEEYSDVTIISFSPLIEHDAKYMVQIMERLNEKITRKKQKEAEEKKKLEEKLQKELKEKKTPPVKNSSVKNGTSGGNKKSSSKSSSKKAKNPGNKKKASVSTKAKSPSRRSVPAKTTKKTEAKSPPRKRSGKNGSAGFHRDKKSPGYLFVFYIFFLLVLPAVPVLSESGTISTSYSKDSIFIPAVYRDTSGIYHGVYSTLTLTLTNGTGDIFMETTPLTQVDMQGAARLAVNVAGTMTGKDLNSYNFYFSVKTNSTIVGGPSAGASMTVLTVALLMGWDIQSGVIMTGTINPDGTIGPVGAVLQKAEAAKMVNANVFLVPYGQAGMVNGNNVSATVWNEYDIDVHEVLDINDALEYFTGHKFTVNNVTVAEPTAASVNVTRGMSDRIMSNAQNLKNLTSSLKLTGNNEYTYLLALSEYNQSLKSYTSRDYYSAASYAFRASVNFRDVLWLYKYTNGNLSMSDLYNDVSGYVNNIAETNSNLNVQYVSDIQFASSVESRVRESVRYVNMAESYMNGNLYSTAISNLAYAYERAYSAVSWRLAYNETDKSGGIFNGTLQDLASEYFTLCYTTISYAQTLVTSGTAAMTELSQANTYMDYARDDYSKGYYGSALMNAINANTWASTAIIIYAGYNVQEYIDLAKQKSAQSIEYSRADDIEPYVAVNMWEYASSLENQSQLIDALVYYEFAYSLSSFSNLKTSDNGVHDSVFTGYPEIRKKTVDSTTIFMVSFVAGAIGIAGGFLSAKLYYSESSVPQVTAIPFGDTKYQKRREDDGFMGTHITVDDKTDEEVPTEYIAPSPLYNDEDE